MWCVGLTPLGDLITGCADGYVRVFSKEPTR